MKIVAADYKGKWFVLQDEDIEDEFCAIRPEISIEYVTGEGLRDHVENCLYYGIPAYLGNDKELHDKIRQIEKELVEDQNI